MFGFERCWNRLTYVWFWTMLAICGHVLACFSQICFWTMYEPWFEVQWLKTIDLNPPLTSEKLLPATTFGSRPMKDPPLVQKGSYHEDARPCPGWFLRSLADQFGRKRTTTAANFSGALGNRFRCRYVYNRPLIVSCPMESFHIMSCFFNALVPWLSWIDQFQASPGRGGAKTLGGLPP